MTSITKSIRYDASTGLYDCYLIVNGREEYLTSMGTYGAAERIISQAYEKRLAPPVEAPAIQVIRFDEPGCTPGWEYRAVGFDKDGFHMELDWSDGDDVPAIYNILVEEREPDSIEEMESRLLAALALVRYARSDIEQRRKEV